MSPWFAIASPASHRAGPRSRRVVPASIVTRPVASSTSVMPVSRDGSTRTPSVGTIGVIECPAPAARTCSPFRTALRTASANSSMLAGAMIAVGSQL